MINTHKTLLFVMSIFMTQSIHAFIPPSALILATHAPLVYAQAQAGSSAIGLLAAVSYMTLRHQSSLKSGIEKFKNSELGKKSTDVIVSTQGKIKNYSDQWRQYLINKLQNNNVHNKTTCNASHTQPQGFTGQQNMQAAQETTATGILNFPKNTTHNQTTVNHNYAPQTFTQTFFAWLEQGKQTRALGAGVFLGTGFGYGVHAATHKAEKPTVVEKIIVVQPASTQDQNSSVKVVASEPKTF